MRPSDETQRRQCALALEVLDCEELDSHVFSDLCRKSVGYVDVLLWPRAGYFVGATSLPASASSI
jgi:hypothetical protein